MTTYNISNTDTVVNGLSSPWDEVVPGDTLVVQSRPSESNLTFRYLTGTSSLPIKIVNESDSQITIDDNSNSFALRIENACRYLDFYGNGNSDITYGFLFYGQPGGGWSIRVTEGSQNIRFFYCHVPGGTTGVSALSTAAQGYDDTTRLRGLLFRHCKFTDTDREALYLGSSNTGDAYYDDVLVEYCILKNIGWDGMQGKHGDNIIFRYNYLENICTELEPAQRSAARLGNTATNSYIYNNFLMNCYFNGLVANTGTGAGPLGFYNNVLNGVGTGATCDGALVLQSNDSSVVEMYNNTVYNVDGDGLVDNNPQTYHRFINNIVAELSNGNYTNASGSTLLANWTGSGVAARFIDYVTLHPSKHSPFLRQGSKTLYPNFDYNGASRPQGRYVTPGAYQWPLLKMALDQHRRRI